MSPMEALDALVFAPHGEEMDPDAKSLASKVGDGAHAMLRTPDGDRFEIRVTQVFT